MHTILETIFRLDGAEDSAGLAEFLQQSPHDPNEILAAIYHLLNKNRLTSALLLARFLDQAGYENQVIALALCLGGLACGDVEAERRGLESLPALAEQLTAEQQANTYQQILLPVLLPLLEKLHQEEDRGRILRLLEILKADLPALRDTFDWQAMVGVLSLEEMRRQSRAPERPLPPIPPQRQSRSVLVAMRAPFTPGDGPCLVHVGKRWVTALRAYGWQANHYSIPSEALCDDGVPLCAALVAACRQQQAEIVLLDDGLLLPFRRARAEMIAQLRRETPTVKVVGCYVEPWALEPALLAEAASWLDAIWCSEPLPLWSQPPLADRWLALPLPGENRAGVQDQPLSGQMLLVGDLDAIENSYHLFWLAAAETLGLPVKKSLAVYHGDLLRPLAEPGAAVPYLNDAPCHLRFTLRVDQRRTLHRQSFATLLGGGLLIQERTEEMHRYFIPGEHYLEFATLAELVAVGQFLRNEPEAAEAIRRRGHAFAQTHYGHEALVGHLDGFLYGASRTGVASLSPPSSRECALYGFHAGGVAPLFACELPLPFAPPQPADHAGRPVLLSICIPTYNRQMQLAQTLDHLQWTLDAEWGIEIIVSNNASRDDTERVALERGQRFPHFRYVRQPVTVDGDINATTVLRLARGKFFIWMGDDDLLIPEALLAEINHLDRQDGIVASHVAAQMWSTVTNSERGLVYQIQEPRLFGKGESVELFNFILAHKVFPEWGIYRTDTYMKVLMVPHPQRAYFPLIRTFCALAYGSLRFQPRPFYRVVVQASLKRHDMNQENEGLRQVTTYADQYRAGIEMAVSLALSQVGIMELAAEQRVQVLDLVNDFVVGRISVAARIAQHRGNFIAAAEFLKRWLLWAKSDVEKQMIREAEPEVLAGAVVQAVGELFAVSLGARRLVLCFLEGLEAIQARLRQQLPEVPVVVCDLPTILAATDRREALYWTDQQAVATALREAGIDAGRILLHAELQHMFRVTG
ncbi:MAG: glycosyltransferase [Magnetococcus sp. MYC-9]